MILGHQIRLDPTPRQKVYFHQACGTVRFTWNWALAAWKIAYEAGEKPSGRALKKQFNAIRRQQFPWTYEVHRDCTARPFDNLQTAFQHFFRRVKNGEKPGYPRFKKKGKCGDSFYISCDKIRFSKQRVRLPIIGWVNMQESLRFKGKMLGAVVSQIADQWHIAVNVDVGDIHRDRTDDSSVGIDLGIKASATLSTGEVVEGPKALSTNIKKLKRLSRRHNRKQKGSNEKKKSAMKLARFHLRIVNIRKDHLHKLSTRLCRENQAIGIEDLHVAGMVRNQKLARHIMDEAWSELRRQLNYKAPMYGTAITVADRWFPSSKTCSGCGYIKDALPLSVRTYECTKCGLVIGRDHNAALNLESKNVPQGMGELTLVEIVALAGPLGLVKLRSSKPESSSRYLRW